MSDDELNWPAPERRSIGRVVTHDELARLTAERDAALAEAAMLREALEMVNRVLCVPAAEYVPAIKDAFDIIDDVPKASPRADALRAVVDAARKAEEHASMTEELDARHVDDLRAAIINISTWLYNALAALDAGKETGDG